MKNTNSNKKNLSPKQGEELLKTLKSRFEKNMNRHKGIEWTKVEAKLKKNSNTFWSLNEMERTGGEPDVVAYDNLPAGKAGKTGEYIFYDCSAESPKDRRSLCYDAEALASRKEHKPKDSAVNMANAMGIVLMTEEQYFELQKLGKPASPAGGFDAKTSSWLKTPAEIRKLGGAISGEFRFGRVFIYANGAESYFASRGFRGVLKV